MYIVCGCTVYEACVQCLFVYNTDNFQFLDLLNKQSCLDTVYIYIYCVVLWVILWCKCVAIMTKTSLYVTVITGTIKDAEHE